MKMIRPLFLIITLAANTQASAASIPYPELESLRRLTVATRVASDAPNSKQIKACQMKSSEFAKLGSFLALQTESTKADWQNLILSKKDLAELKIKISHCKERGSCSVYFDFLGAVKVYKPEANEMAALKAGLEAKLRTLDAKSYLEAWDDLKNPCALIKNALL